MQQGIPEVRGKHREGFPPSTHKLNFPIWWDTEERLLGCIKCRSWIVLEETILQIL